MRTLGIDYGSKRVGIAISDESGEFALPEKVLQNGGKDSLARLVSEVAEIIHRSHVKEVVVGESKDYKGAMNPIMIDVTAFVIELKEKTGLPVIMEPEFMTSMNAERVRKELNGSAEHVDASAAALILQSYLDRKKSAQENLNN